MRVTDKQTNRIINALLAVYNGEELEKIKFVNGFTLGLCNNRVMVVEGGIGREYRNMYIEFGTELITMWDNNGEILQFIEPKEYNADEMIAILSFMVMNERMRIDDRKRG